MGGIWELGARPVVALGVCEEQLQRSLCPEGRGGEEMEREREAGAEGRSHTLGRM